MSLKHASDHHHHHTVHHDHESIDRSVVRVNEYRQRNGNARTIDAGVWVILDPEINMLRDSKAEVTRLAEVPPDELKLFHLESRLQELQSLIASHGHVARNLLITSN